MGNEEAVAAQKTALRDRLVTVRRRRSLEEVRVAAEAIAEHLLATPTLQDAATVTAYVSIGTEPGTGPLLDVLAESGKRVLLPVVLPDLDLDWAVYDGRLAEARMGLLEPVGRRLGTHAVRTADLLLVPGLAVGRDGTRMGRGGGCYDRALSRIEVGTPTCVLLYDGEVLDEVPAAPHDMRVAAAVTPSGITRLRAPA